MFESCVRDETNPRSLIIRFNYDDFGREAARSVKYEEEILYRLNQIYGEANLTATRSLENCQGQKLLHQSFQYNNKNRLNGCQCQVSHLSMNGQKNHFQEQYLKFDDFDNIIQVFTIFQDQSQNIVSYIYNENPTQTTRIVNTHANYFFQIDLIYNDNGSLIQD